MFRVIFVSDYTELIFVLVNPNNELENTIHCFDVSCVVCYRRLRTASINQIIKS